MPYGDLEIECKIGDMNLSKDQTDAFCSGLTIRYDILNVFGPVCEINCIDTKDSLAKKGVFGSFDDDVSITLKGDSNSSLGNNRLKLKLKQYRGKNLDDLSHSGPSTGKFKKYKIRCVSPESLKCQGNWIEKSFDDKKTSEMVKYILENGFKTDKQMDISETKGKRRIVIPRSNPYDALMMLNHEHVSNQDESSLFALFQQPDSNGGEHKYVFKTFEELGQQQSVVTLKQTVLNASSTTEQDIQNSIRWIKVADSFFTGNRALSKTAETSFDLTSHKVVEVKDQKQKPNFKTTNQTKTYENHPSYIEEKPIKSSYLQDKVIQEKAGKHDTSTAKTKRAAAAALFSQNDCTLECYFNPKIVVGSCIDIDIPQKSEQSEGGEGSFNKKCLVTSVEILFTASRTPDQPNCVMRLGLTGLGSVGPKARGGQNG